MSLVVDSSAIVAVVAREPQAAAVWDQLQPRPRLFISAATWLECSIVIDGRGSVELRRSWDDLARELDLSVEPVTVAQAAIAREAYRDFGRGRGHPAQLNFSDCFSYALAVDLRLPLLAVGDDFRRTGIDVVP